MVFPSSRLRETAKAAARNPPVQAKKPLSALLLLGNAVVASKYTRQEGSGQGVIIREQVGNWPLSAKHAAKIVLQTLGVVC